MQFDYQPGFTKFIERQQNKPDREWECATNIAWLVAFAEKNKADWERFGLTFCRETNEYSWGLSRGKIELVLSLATICKKATNYLDDTGEIDIRKMIIALYFKEGGEVDYVIAESDVINENEVWSVPH